MVNLCCLALLDEEGVGFDDVGYLLGVFANAVGVSSALDYTAI